MLNNINIYILAFLTISLVSCSNDDVDPLFDTDVNTRVNEQLDSLRKALLSAENGWKVEYQPENTVGIFNIYLKFNEDSTVDIASDFDNGDQDLPTTYRVSISQKPELVLENFTVFHRLFEANFFSLGAEFEFLFENVTEDIITLKSKTDSGEKSTLTFVKALTSDKGDIIALQGLDARIEKENLTDKPFTSLKLFDNNSEEIFTSSYNFDKLSRTITLFYDGDNNNEVEDRQPIKITQEGFDFVSPITLLGTEFQSFTYDETNNYFIAIVGDVTAIINGTDLPGYINNDGLGLGDGRFTQFLYRPSLGAHPLTSSGFDAIMAQVNANIAGFGFSVFEFRTIIDINDPDGNTYLEVTIVNADGGSITLFYDLRPSIQDKKIFFEYIAPFGDTSALLETQMAPLINFWLSTEGLIYTNRGTFQNFSNLAGQFLNAQDPSLSVYAVWL